MEQPIITIIILVTREWAQKDLFKCLEDLEVDPFRTQTIFYIDTDDPRINEQHMREYPNVRVLRSLRGGPSEVRINSRRDRIAQNHNNIKNFIQPESEIVIGFEDDTLFRPDAAKRLLETMKDPSVGFVEGVQVGRWSHKYVGAWKVDNIIEPTTIESLTPEQGKQEIDAGGFYCFATRAELYKSIPHQWHDECFGPDVCYGLEVRKRGYKNIIDWDIICGHNDYGKILLPDCDIVKIKYVKQGEKWKIQWTD